jgi:glycosyl transferase family 87
VSLTVGTVWAERNGKKKTAGILLAIAVGLKPTVAGGLVLYYLVRRRWKVAGIACAAAAMLGALGVFRLAVAGVPWLASYLENTRRMFSPGSLDDFARADAIRFNMIQAQVIFYSLVRNVSLADWMARLLGAALLGYWLWACWRRRSSELLEISAISVLSLTCVYHRFYDTALLIWPLAWGLLLVRRRSTAIVTLAMIAPFFVPGAALLTESSFARRIPPTIANSWWWSTLVLPYAVWDLILIAILLLYWMSPGESEELPPGRQSSERMVVRQDSALSEPSSS